MCKRNNEKSSSKIACLKQKFENHIAKMHCVGVFGVNDNKNVDVSCAQATCCILCYNSLVSVPNPKDKAKNTLIFQNKLYEITSLEKKM